MAISEVDLILIDKQIKGTLTAKEHAMWSRRMQDRDFIRVWHAAHDDFLHTLLEEMKEEGRVSSEKDVRSPCVHVGRGGLTCVMLEKNNKLLSCKVESTWLF